MPFDCEMNLLSQYDYHSSIGIIWLPMYVLLLYILLSLGIFRTFGAKWSTDYLRQKNCNRILTMPNT